LLRLLGSLRLGVGTVEWAEAVDDDHRRIRGVKLIARLGRR
jgi:hypothetical protein